LIFLEIKKKLEDERNLKTFFKLVCGNNGHIREKESKEVSGGPQEGSKREEKKNGMKGLEISETRGGKREKKIHGGCRSPRKGACRVHKIKDGSRLEIYMLQLRPKREKKGSCDPKGSGRSKCQTADGQGVGRWKKKKETQSKVA